MDVNEALRTIETLARIALEIDDEELSVETLADTQRRTLHRIVVMTGKALAKALQPQGAERVEMGSELDEDQRQLETEPEAIPGTRPH